MVNEERSLNHDMMEGISDGTVKKLAPDRGGVVEMTGPSERLSLLQQQYGITGNYGAASDVARRITGLY